MFGRNNIDKIIRTGNLPALKLKLEKNPSALNNTLSWSHKDARFSGNALHMAASFNQTEIIAYLVCEKEMDVNALSSQSWTPLHHAAKCDSVDAVKKLLMLGTNPSAKTSNRTQNFARDLTSSPSLKKLLQDHQDAYDAVKNLEEKKRRAHGEWTELSESEIIFERTLPGDRYHLTKIFNFASATCTIITENLKSGRIAQDEKKFEALADQDIIKTARAKLAEINGHEFKTDTADGRRQPQRTIRLPNGYDKLRNPGK